MPTENVLNKSIDIWHTTKLRITAFTTTPLQGSIITWWKDLINDEPAEQTSFPKKGIYRFSGPYLDGILTLNIEPVRIDWFYDTIIDKENKSTIDTFSEGLNKFIPLMSKWFEYIPEIPIGRLALGTILQIPVKNRKIGYEIISSYLPDITLDSENSSDFFYQINRPRASKLNIDDLVINRLSKWQVISIISGQTPLGQSELGYIPFMEDYSCRLELDINTSNKFKGLLPSDKTNDIFQELVELGKEIAEKGDIS